MYFIAAVWLGLAVVSAIIAYHLKLSIALVEIIVGVIAAAFANHYVGPNSLGNNFDWLRFLASSGAVLLTFLAGAELDPKVIKFKWKEVLTVGFTGFLMPFFVCTAAAYYLLHWSVAASWLCGVALSSTSMAVIYSVMLDTGLNVTEFGKGILGASFINDISTVLALGLLFAPFTSRSLVFVGVCLLVFVTLPTVTNYFTSVYGNRTAAIRVKWLVFVLFSLGALAVWSGSEAVLPAYIAGIILAEFASQNHLWIKRLRTLTVGLLTPFYFLRAGSLVVLHSLLVAPAILLILFVSKVFSKIFGLFPIVSIFRRDRKERWFYTLLMSTGLTFGTIAALFGFSHGIIDAGQYSIILLVIIASAVIPSLIANYFFIPKKLHGIRSEGPEEE